MTRITVGRSVGRSITEPGQCVLTGADDADEAPSGPSLEFWTWMLLGLKRKNGEGKSINRSIK